MMNKIYKLRQERNAYRAEIKMLSSKIDELTNKNIPKVEVAEIAIDAEQFE